MDILDAVSRLGAIVAFASFLFAVFTYSREAQRSGREDAMRIIIYRNSQILTIENTSEIVATNLEVTIGTGVDIRVVNVTPDYVKSKDKVELDLSDPEVIAQPAPTGYVHVAFTGPRGLRWVRDSDQVVRLGPIRRKRIRRRLQG